MRTNGRIHNFIVAAEHTEVSSHSQFSAFSNMPDVMSASAKAESSSWFPKTNQKLWYFTWKVLLVIHVSCVHLSAQFWVQRPRIVSWAINNPCDSVERSVCDHRRKVAGKDAFHKHAATDPNFPQRSVLYDKLMHPLELSQDPLSKARPWHWEHEQFWWNTCDSTLGPVTFQKPQPSAGLGMLNYWQGRSLVIRLSHSPLPRPAKPTAPGQYLGNLQDLIVHGTIQLFADTSPCPEAKYASKWKSQIWQREMQICLN